MARKYELRSRAERQLETRRRIVEAAIDLHTTVGPARTSISAVAERAGVQRHTVYAHFPDERSLFRACSGHWRDQHPFPSVESMGLRAALTAVYAWYEDVEDALALFARDADRYPEIWTERARRFAALADALARPLGRRKAVRAAVGHALAFETWRSLVCREGLTNRQAVDAMVAFVHGV
jgi:AcrR family transcriptional regulator